MISCFPAIKVSILNNNIVSTPFIEQLTTQCRLQGACWSFPSISAVACENMRKWSAHTKSSRCIFLHSMYVCETILLFSLSLFLCLFVIHRKKGIKFACIQCAAPTLYSQNNKIRQHVKNFQLTKSKFSLIFPLKSSKNSFKISKVKNKSFRFQIHLKFCVKECLYNHKFPSDYV